MRAFTNLKVSSFRDGVKLQGNNTRPPINNRAQTLQPLLSLFYTFILLLSLNIITTTTIIIIITTTTTSLFKIMIVI
jgi:hypothetical protein